MISIHGCYNHVNVFIPVLCNASGALTCLTAQVPWELAPHLSQLKKFDPRFRSSPSLYRSMI